MKKAPANFRKEQAGVVAIANVARDWGWAWRETQRPDTGVDGTLEVFDGNVATGKQVAVQSKAGRSYLRNETDATFEFHADPDDLEYWVGYALPVVLMVFDPTLDVLYAVSIKDYVRDQSSARTKPHRILFDKVLDVVADDATAMGWIRDVAFGKLRDYKQRKPIKIVETLHTNLLIAKQRPIHLYGAAPKKEHPKDARPNIAYIERDGLWWMFHDPRTNGSALTDFVDVAQVQQVNCFGNNVEEKYVSYSFDLMYRSLRMHLRGLPIAFDKKRKRYYFLPKEKQKRTWDYKSVHRKATRTVAGPLKGKYWAHQAARLTFEAIGGQLFLKLVPAYVFTINGSDVQTDEDVIRLNVMKRKKEYNRQVFQHLIFWREVLARHNVQIEIATGGPALIFSKDFLAQTATFGIYEDRRTLDDIAAPTEDEIDETALEAEEDDLEDEEGDGAHAEEGDEDHEDE